MNDGGGALTIDLVKEIKERIIDTISRFDVNGKEVRHKLPDLSIVKISEESTTFCGLYKPSIGLIVSGSKLLNVGSEQIHCPEASYLITAIGIPMSGQTRAAGPNDPYIGILLPLDMDRVRALVMQYEISYAPSKLSSSSIIGEATPRLLELFSELIALDPEDPAFSFMNSHIRTEIFFRILCGPHGNHLRDLAMADTTAQRIDKVVQFITQNYAQQTSVEQLAGKAHMGVSTFHHHFKEATGMSPLQFQKQIRLHRARAMLLSRDRDIASVALAVGYESQSQFSREFRRVFGHPPSQALSESSDFLREWPLISA